MANRRTVFAQPAELVGAVDMSELLRDANGEVYQVGGLIHDGGGQRYLEMFGTEYEIIPGGDYSEAIRWPLRLVQVIPALGADERRSLAHRARQESDEYADPRYHKDLDVTERRKRSDRWREIADALHSDPYGRPTALDHPAHPGVPCTDLGLNGMFADDEGCTWEVCIEPVWDGPYRMNCGHLIERGECTRHGARAKRRRCHQEVVNEPASPGESAAP